MHPAAVEGFTSCYMAGRDIVSIFDDLLSLARDLYLYKATQKTDFLMSRWRELAPALSESCSLKRLEGFSGGPVIFPFEGDEELGPQAGR